MMPNTNTPYIFLRHAGSIFLICITFNNAIKPNLQNLRPEGRIFKMFRFSKFTGHARRATCYTVQKCKCSLFLKCYNCYCITNVVQEKKCVSARKSRAFLKICNNKATFYLLLFVKILNPRKASELI